MRIKPILILLIVVIVALFGSYMLLNKNPSSDSRPSLTKDIGPIYFYQLNWLVYKGDSPDANAEWKPFNSSSIAEMSDYKGIAWIRFNLPKILPERDPYLTLFGFKHFEAFIDGELEYSFNMERNSIHIHPIMKIHQIQLQDEDAGKRLEIRMQWNDNNYRSVWNLIGTRYEILWSLLEMEWSTIVHVVLFLSAGLASTLIFISRKQDPLYMWFALFAFSAGFGILYEMLLLQWFVESESIYYWKDLLLPFGMFAFVGFYGDALRLSSYWVFRLMKGILLAYTTVSFIAGWYNDDLYWKLLVDYLPYVFVPVFIVVSFFAVKQYRKNRDREALWLLVGYSLLLITVFIHLLLNLFPPMVSWLLSLPFIIDDFINLELQSGLLLFMLCLAMVLFHRFSDVYKQVEQNRLELAAKNEELERFHRSLEDIVELRTKELEEANRSLEASVRETAVTLAEVSVLEERNRIAHEIHDVVGHTLTAAIVQLEASKKLAGRDLTKSVEKLDIINGLVRKGLDDIRRSVRLLKDEGETFELHVALEDLIRDTAFTMGVEIDAHIETLPPLAWLTQRVIYHALQEGLTNGIRHGNCSLFTFTLRQEEHRLRFLLINDGAPFGTSKPGFGLTTMMERIHLLGGTVEVGAIREGNSFGSAKYNDSEESSAAEGIGCRLEITLPIVSA